MDTKVKILSICMKWHSLENWQDPYIFGTMGLFFQAFDRNTWEYGSSVLSSASTTAWRRFHTTTGKNELVLLKNSVASKHAQMDVVD